MWLHIDDLKKCGSLSGGRPDNYPHLSRSSMENQMAGWTKFYAILMDDFELIHLNTLLRRIEAHPLKMWVIVRATARVGPYKDNVRLQESDRVFVGADPCGRPDNDPHLFGRES